MIKKERENMTVKTLEQAFADAVINPENLKAVSYTHLTLPTTD